MLTKKEFIMGKEVKLEMDVLQTIRNFFGAKEEQKIIRHGTPEYRHYKKKIVAEGRAVEWQGVSSRADKEALFKRRSAMRYKGGI